MDATQQFDSPMHLKGEAAAPAYDFSLDMDHRKRRRNRTTQSCLNCHTSKRKCDRKRPCQRCIQLGLTGLCVYEIDDPSIRDDPNVDENTRFRNRIAELESLVRELRGKPHPRWADANFCDGDPNEKWHSRASKRPPGMRLDLRRQRSAFDIGPHHDGSHSGTPIKSEPGDLAQNFPYRFSPSPDSSQASPYQMFPPQTSASYQEHSMQYGNGNSGNSSGEGSAGSSYSPYMQAPGVYHSDAHGADPRYRSQHSDPRGEVYCPCHANPNATAALVGLSQQLQGSLSVLRGLQEHSGHAPCTLTRRIQDLSDILHQCCAEPYSAGSDSTISVNAGYESLSTPPDSDVITPLSSGEAAPIRATQLQEWQALSQAQGSAYNPYFPPLPERAVAHGFPKELEGGHHQEFHSVI
ncbi:hypothetical protein BC834DRAFT_957183 [Gloeopeniophorella convolvens]|nr:hypothetical protein BC834DRAFT_957183 [Gloeopeniophorella convolvens]